MFELSKKNIEKYLECGGIPMYEGRYTIWGEIVVGSEILDNFAKIHTELNHKPKNDVSILSTVWLSKKDFKNKYSK